MSAAPRDREALDLVATRSFSGAAVVDLKLTTQARRLEVRVYGPLHGSGTQLGSLTFYAVTALAIDDESGDFPESVSLSSFEFSYSDDEESGTARMTGTRGWSASWLFEGLAYEEVPAVIASLRDDL